MSAVRPPLPPAGAATAPTGLLDAGRRRSSDHPRLRRAEHCRAAVETGQDVTAHCPRSFLTGPSAFGRMSKSKIAVGR